MISILLLVISIVSADIQGKNVNESVDDLLLCPKHKICHNTELSVCLCGELISDTILVLLPTIEYSFDPQHNCIISRLKNFKLVGRNGVAIVKCDRNIGSILFRQVENLEITNIHFRNCGSTLPDSYLVPNITKQGQQAAIYISLSKSLVLRNVSITNYKGFAFLIVEIHHVFIESIEVSFTKCCANEQLDISCSCSGMVVYHNQPQSNPSEIKFTLQNSKFHANYNGHITNPTRQTFCDTITTDTQPSLHISASFTLIISQANINKITINNNKFTNNTGISGAGILITLITNYYIPRVLPLSIENNTFKRNTLVNDKQQTCIGSAIKIQLASHYGLNSYSNLIAAIPLVTIYMNNITISRHLNKSAISITSFGYMKVTANISSLQCNDNTPSYNGMCLTAKVHQPLTLNPLSGTFEIYIENVKAKGNILWSHWQKHATMLGGNLEAFYRPSLFLFVNIPLVVFRGSSNDPCHFHGNDVPIVVSIQSKITLAGTIEIKNLLISTAIHLIDSSYLTLQQHINISFTGKYINQISEALIDISTDRIGSLCAIQLHIDQCNVQHIMDSYHTTMFDNSILHLTPAYNCILHSNIPNCIISIKDIYKIVFDNATIRSNPVGVFYFENGKPKTGHIQDTLQIYPGYSFRLCMALLDHDRNIIPGTILIKLFTNETTHHGRKNLIFFNNKTTLVETSYDYTTCRKYFLIVYKRHWSLAQGKLIVSEMGMQPSLLINMVVKECPIGFMLVSGKCTCSKFMMRIKKRDEKVQVTCELIQHEKSNNFSTILRIKQHFWLGIGNKATIKRACHKHRNNNSIAMLYSGICPLGFCNYTKDYTDTTIENDLCIGRRKGQVCSECEHGYSTVFGSKRCYKCSNMWLWTIPVYMLFGIILVFILLLLNLTISHGAFTSIVLYSNAGFFGLSDIVAVNPDLIGHYSVIVSSINLYNDFPICLYNGMTDTVKTALQFVFPVYTWLLVIMVILISRNSSLVTNWIVDRSVQVLVTIFHLSYIKVLLTTVTVLTPLKVLVENTETNGTTIVHLWNANPSIPYGSTWEHILLIIVAIAFLMLFLLPYLVLSLFVPFCWHRRLVIRLRPVFETMYGPYKQEHSYWFGIRVFILTLLAVVSTSMQGANIYTELLTFQLVLLFLIIAQAFVNPFQNKIVSIIDIYFLTNVTVIYTLCTFQALRGLLDSSTTRLTIIILYSTILILSVGILSYHTIKYVRPVNNCFVTICRALDNRYPILKLSERMNINKTTEQYQEIEDDSNTVLREPLLQ